jgi:hypothetical protein
MRSDAVVPIPEQHLCATDGFAGAEPEPFSLPAAWQDTIHHNTSEPDPVGTNDILSSEDGATGIHEVTELDTGSSLEYYIRVEDDYDWMTVRASIGGDFKVVAKEKKP